MAAPRSLASISTCRARPRAESVIRMASPPMRASLTSSARMSRTAESAGGTISDAHSSAVSIGRQGSAAGARLAIFGVTVDRLRVFVNERPVEVARGAAVRDAVAALDPGLAELVAAASAYVTDGVGRTLDAGDVVREAGGVFRVIVTARRTGAPSLSKETLRRWPKAELHVHLDGSLRPATMLELAREQHVRLPADTPDALARALSVQGSTTLEEYLTKYQLTLAVMQTA